MKLAISGRKGEKIIFIYIEQIDINFFIET